MIGIAKLKTLEAVAAAMRRTAGWDEAWWAIPDVETPLRTGERLGWLFRLSTTQVHWTEGGVAAFREFRRSSRDRECGVNGLAARAVVLLTGLTTAQIENSLLSERMRRESQSSQ